MYSNPTEALNAQKLHISSLENSIPSTQESFGGTAKIVLPSLSLIKIQGVVRKNNPPEVMVDFVAQSVQEAIMSMARVLKKQNLFESLTIEQSIDTIDPELNGKDYLIWMEVQSKDSANWYLKSDYIKKHKINLDYAKRKITNYWWNRIIWNHLS